MNLIEKIRNELQECFLEAKEISYSDENDVSPSGNYSINTKAFTVENCRKCKEITTVRISKIVTEELLFSFIVNDGTFFYSWVTKNGIEYLVCTEDLCGGQTIIDLTNKRMSSYSEDNDGFIWTKHLLSPDEKHLAVFGCSWGTLPFVVIYQFEDFMELPLKITSEPNWIGFDILEWVDNYSLRVKNTESEEAIIKVL